MFSPSPMKSEIKAIIFDLGNVLVNFDGKRAAIRFSKDCRVPILKVFHHFFFSKDDNAYVCGRISSKTFYQRAVRKFKVDMDYETFKQYWCQIFWENKGMEELVAKLKKKYRLYLISNTNQLHFDYIKKHYPILRHFNRVFPSHKMGVRKPDVRIYKRVLKTIRLAPAETVFIDDIAGFVRAAKHVGMKGIRFKGKKKLISDFKKLGILV